MPFRMESPGSAVIYRKPMIICNYDMGTAGQDEADLGRSLERVACRFHALSSSGCIDHDLSLPILASTEILHRDTRDISRDFESSFVQFIFRFTSKSQQAFPREPKTLPMPYSIC